jgi:hypothetical protein
MLVAILPAENNAQHDDFINQRQKPSVVLADDIIQLSREIVS